MSYAKTDLYTPVTTRLSLAEAAVGDRPDGRAAAFARVVLQAARAPQVRAEAEAEAETGACAES